MTPDSPLSPDVITNIAFGLTGAVLAVFMIWQAARYAAQRSRVLGPEQDMELAAITAMHNTPSQSLPRPTPPEPNQVFKPAPGELADVAPPLPPALLRGSPPHS